MSAKNQNANPLDNQQTIGGIALIASAFMAIAVSNSFMSGWYESLLSTPMSIIVGDFDISKPLLLWVNDGLMAVFFFLVGLEIKREIIEGDLSTKETALLPLVAAIGGMALPALIFLLVNWQYPQNLVGWAIPAATDIAFALGILALLGPAVPAALKVLLLGIAIIDDLGAIVAIALFYTSDLSATSLLVGFGGLAVLVAFNRLGVKSLAPYILVGLVVWVGVLKSGVHATLAGVLVALTVPLTAADGESPLKTAEHALHPWVAFFIVPVFAFFNAGVSFSGISLSEMVAPLPLGVALGLFAGKQLGVFLSSAAAIKTGLCRLPEGITWRQLYGVACLTGIGFTMSLFIGTLAFETDAQLNAVRLGVIMGSILSTIVGVAILKMPPPELEPASANLRRVQ